MLDEIDFAQKNNIAEKSLFYQTLTDYPSEFTKRFTGVPVYKAEEIEGLLKEILKAA